MEPHEDVRQRVAYGSKNDHHFGLRLESSTSKQNSSGSFNGRPKKKGTGETLERQELRRHVIDGSSGCEM